MDDFDPEQDPDGLMKLLQLVMSGGDREKLLRSQLAQADATPQPYQGAGDTPLGAGLGGLANVVGAFKRGRRVDAAEEGLKGLATERTNTRAKLLRAMRDPLTTSSDGTAPQEGAEYPGPTRGSNQGGTDALRASLPPNVAADMGILGDDYEPSQLDHAAALSAALQRPRAAPASATSPKAPSKELLQMIAGTGDEVLAPYAQQRLAEMARAFDYTRSRADKLADTGAERTFDAQKMNAEMQAHANEGAANRAAEEQRLREELASRERVARLGAGKKAKGEAGPQGIAPGIEGDPNIKLSPEELAKTREAIGAQQNIKAKIGQLRDLIKANGSMLTGPNSARAKDLVSSIKLDMNKVANLSRLTAPELELFKAQVPDPTTASSMFTRNDTMAATLDQLENDIDTRVSSHLNAIGARGGGSAPAQTSGPTPTGKFKVVKGVRWLEMSDGSAVKAP